MKEIKRYTDTINYDKDEPYSSMTLFKGGHYVKLTDHKAVVETLTKRCKIQSDMNVTANVIIDEKNQYICELEYQLKGFKDQYIKSGELVETMQKRIEELEENKKEFCGLLVNPYDYSDRETDEIIERAEECLDNNKV